MTHFFRPAAILATRDDHGPQILRPLTWYVTVIFLLSMCFFTSCQKQLNNSGGEEQLSVNKPAQTGDEVLAGYTGLEPQTIWELQQARAASARYRNINNAIRDGYTNIGVDVENMGHHYMRSDIVDGTFDIRQPEILVYNGREDGTQELVAVEYAVPLTFPKPEGFTGSADVWNGTSGFPLWLLHAWVWHYNPDGVFNWTNPLVDLH
jgi:hypothetical protein